MLEMSDSRDAYLTSLCAHTLTDTASPDHSHPGRAEGVTSPTGAHVLDLALLDHLVRGAYMQRASLKSSQSGMDGTSLRLVC